MKKVAHRDDAAFEKQVIAARGRGGHEQDAKGGAFGVVDGERVAAGHGGRDIVPESVLLVVGVIRQELVGQFFGGFRAHVHFEEEKGVAAPWGVRDVETVGVER